MRFMKPKPLLPIATTCALLPAVSISRSLVVTARNIFVFKPPHRPLSVVTSTMPTGFAASLDAMKGWMYSGLAIDRCPAMAATLSL